MQVHAQLHSMKKTYNPQLTDSWHVSISVPCPVKNCSADVWQMQMTQSKPTFQSVALTLTEKCCIGGPGQSSGRQRLSQLTVQGQALVAWPGKPLCYMLQCHWHAQHQAQNVCKIQRMALSMHVKHVAQAWCAIICAKQGQYKQRCSHFKILCSQLEEGYYTTDFHIQGVKAISRCTATQSTPALNLQHSWSCTGHTCYDSAAATHRKVCLVVQLPHKQLTLPQPSRLACAILES